VLKVSFPHLVWEPDPVFTAGRIFPSPLVYVLLGLAQVRPFCFRRLDSVFLCSLRGFVLRPARSSHFSFAVRVGAGVQAAGRFPHSKFSCLPCRRAARVFVARAALAPRPRSWLLVCLRFPLAARYSALAAGPDSILCARFPSAWRSSAREQSAPT
jgi:hypothetical protein